MKSRFSLAAFLGVIALISSPLAWAQNDDSRPPLDLSKLPASAGDIGSFAPAGWKIEQNVQSDLNGDNDPDVVLGLIEDVHPANPDDFAIANRAIIVLLHTEGKYRLAGASNKLLLCRGCAGMLDSPTEPSSSISVAKGVIVVDQLRGSRESVNSIHRFRYDPESGRFALIGLDIIERDRAVGNSTSTSTNYLNGKQITIVFRYNEKLDKDVEVKKRNTTIPNHTKVLLDDVSYE